MLQKTIRAFVRDSWEQMTVDTVKTYRADDESAAAPVAFRHPHMVIVAVAVAILLGFAVHAADRLAGDLALDDQLHSIQTQIELYKIHHLGHPPHIQEHGLPQLTASTNSQGQIGTSGPNYARGPYFLAEFPNNPIDGSNHVTAVAEPGRRPTGVAGNLGGWQYDETTGMIWPNNPEYFASRTSE